MKGHMSLKSGPYATTSCKYSTQMLVKANLDAHEKMINRAKPAIDNKTPKAFQTSTKARDKLKREMIKNGRPPPRPMSTDSSYYEYHDDVDGNMYRSRTMNGYNSGLTMTSRPTSTTEFRTSPRYGTRSPSPGRANETAGPPQSPRFTSTGDVLLDRKHVFTEPDRPFTPRTLKSTRKSKLVEKKYYNPPKKSNLKRSNDNKNANDNDEIKENIEKKDDKNVKFDPTKTVYVARKSEDSVPKLDITQDEDHLKWIAKQAELAEARKGMDKDHNTNYETNNNNAKTLEEEEEELELLNFIQEVTNDVLDRGVYTKTALQSIFDYHVDKNADRLNVKKMLDALEKLRNDLEASESQSAQDDTISLASSKGSGLERYKKNLDRTLREADLDYDVAKRNPDDSNELDKSFPPLPDAGDNVDYHPPPSMPFVRDEDDRASQASLKSRGSECATPVPEKSSKRGSIASKISDIVARRGSASSIKSVDKGSVKSLGAASEKSAGQQSESLTRENIRVVQACPETPNSKRGSVASLRSQKSNSTLKADQEEYSDARTPSKRGSVATDDRSLQKSVSEAGDKTNEDTDAQTDAMSEASTLMDDNLGSTMESLAEENKWMKNPSQFTMTLKPGQLDTSVLKPRPSPKKRELRRQKHESQGSLKEGSETGSRSSLKENSEPGSVKDAPVVPPRSSKSSHRGSQPSSARVSELENAIGSDDDF